MDVHIDASMGDLMRMDGIGGRLVPEGLAELVRGTVAENGTPDMRCFTGNVL